MKMFSHFADHFFTYLYQNGVFIHYDGMGVNTFQDREGLSNFLFDHARPDIFTDNYNNFKVHEVIYLRTFKVAKDEDKLIN